MRAAAWCAATTFIALSGCGDSPPSVVVYSALDAEFSEPLFEPFTKVGGVRVRPKFDTEATKTVGLVNTILAESSAGRARCDVFWNNEILGTLRLARRGLLRATQPANGAAFPATFKSADGSWYGFAARARVLIVNTQLVSADDMPTSMWDLADAKWRGRTGIAKPLFGTTATHAACLFATMGPAAARGYFEKLKANDVHILAGNKHVAQSVAAGSIAFGWTDTDDAIIELERGQPVQIVYPDRKPEEVGTLFIPNTVACLHNSPNPRAADEFLNYLLSTDVEAALARGPSAQIPLNPAVPASPRIATPAQIRAMSVDFQAAAEKFDEAARFLDELFGTP